MELADLAVPAATVAAAAITGGLGLAAARTGRAGDDADLYRWSSNYWTGPSGSGP